MTTDALTIDALERWAFFGAHWRVVAISNAQVVVDLCTCMGEPVERLESRDAALIAYLRSAPSNLDLN
jgi:hypothetical protein